MPSHPLSRPLLHGLIYDPKLVYNARCYLHCVHALKIHIKHLFCFYCTRIYLLCEITTLIVINLSHIQYYVWIINLDVVDLHRIE